MKQLIFLSLSIFIFLAAAGQEKNNEQAAQNVIKINLGAIVAKNFSFQYERSVGRKTSAALGIRFQPYGDLPFQQYVEDAIDDPDVQVGNIRIGNFALTPEFRFYFGKQALKGLYIAPYARYATYKMQAPISYTSLLDRKTAFFTGNIRSFSGGILLGSQFSLGKNFILDWWIVGGHFGSSTGSLDFVASLTPQEQQDLRQTLDEADIPLFNIEHNINANGGSIRSKGAWAGFRGFAINLGYRF